MKIVMLNTSDRQGGAAIAASRLREALAQNGVDVKMIVRDKLSEDSDVISINDSWFKQKINRFRFLWERFVIFTRNGFSRDKIFMVSIADTGVDFSLIPEVKEADIIHLHWINHGFLSMKGFKKLMGMGKPIVWTLHDMWATTGICHHAWTCDHYKTECVACPFLHSSGKDLSTSIFQKKTKLYNKKLTLVPVSHWLERKCRESALTGHLPLATIPNTINTDFFTRGDKTAARQRLGLPENKKIIVMGAARIDDPVKGLPLLHEAIRQLSAETLANSILILFGRCKYPENLRIQLPLEVIPWGHLSSSEQLADLYRAADVTVSSSHYETFGQTLSEAMSCGCPAVSFGNSGTQDIIDHLKNGYLARYPDSADLAAGIEWVLSHPEANRLSEEARLKVLACFTVERVAEKYMELYKTLIS